MVELRARPRIEQASPTIKFSRNADIASSFTSSRAAQVPPNSDADRDRLAHAVRAARLQVAFEGQPASLSLATVLATITFALLWPTKRSVALLVWYLVFVAVTLMRVQLYRTHRAIAATATAVELERLQTQFVRACCAAGCSWGLVCVLAFPNDALLKMFLAFVIAGASAAAVTSLSSIRAAALGFVVTCTVPLAVRLLSGFETTEVAMSAMVLMFLIVVSASITRLDGQLLALVRSRMEADEHLRARTQQGEELQALNDRLRLAIQAGKAGTFEWDLTDQTMACDRQIYELYDIDPTGPRFSYEVWRQRLHPQDMAKVERSIDALIKGRDNFYEEFRVVWADGTEKVVKAAALVQRDAEDRAIRIVGMNSDITELKRVDRMKSEFVSIVSHELRTPLTSIRAALGLIASGGAGPIAIKAERLLQLASRNAERLGVLVDNMLDMERIESGKLRFELALQPLQPIIEQSLGVNAAFAASRKVTLQLTAVAADAIAAIDSNRLLQVMTNLLSNAVKFSPEEAYVDVALLTNGSRVTIEVRDRGPGIAPEFQEKLFTKFCQGDSSDTRAQGGSGLGLAISKALVERMNGHISFKTSATGTSFFVDLPLRTSLHPIDDAERTTVVLPMSL
jgi:signal transduction histidine kinase